MGDESVLERVLNGEEEPNDLPLALLQRITKDFSQENKIGQGGFGEVYKGELRNGIIVAVKRIEVNQFTIDDVSFRREFNSLMNTNHQNVVRFLGFCSNTHHTSRKEAGEINLVSVRERILCFEYIRNGSLDKHITDELRGLEWEPRYAIISGICKGLFYLHEEKKTVHMDLKPPNILLDDHMVPKITDFGLSRSNEMSHTTGQRFGTPGYIAPEYEKDGKTSFKCDIYSLGVIITELVTGRKSVPHKNNVLRRWRHRWNNPPTLLQYQQVTRCIEIAVRCGQQDPEARPSIGGIISILSQSESTDGHTGQESTYLDDDMLGIETLEVHFPFRPIKGYISWPVKLSNKTKACFAYNIERPSKQYTIQPDKGIVPPGCNEYLVQIRVQLQERAPQVTQNADKFIVKSTKVSEGLSIEDITEHIFHEEVGKVVDEVDFMVVYEPTKPQENCKSREDTNMPAEEVPKDIDSSMPRHCTEQIEQCKFYPPRRFSHHYPTNPTYLGKGSRKGSRAVDVTRGAMGSLLDKLGKLVKEDYNLESSMKRDIESFSEDLAKIHKDLPNLGKLDGVDIWVDEVRELSYNIEDMVDSFVVRIEPDSSRSGFRELQHEGLRFLENDMTHRQIGDVIRDIKNQVQGVADRQKKYNFGVNNVVANATALAPIDPRMAIYINKQQLIGIEAQTNELIRMFEEDGDVSKQELRIVSIVGLGGLGKTTLAKTVYDKAQYHSKAFVPVGQSYDVKKALKDILFEFGENLYAENLEVWQLQNKLEKFLQDKRYFIVIDDIWDPEAWGYIASAFPRNNHGSRVITTRRIERVARVCCEHESKYVYRMKPLNEEDSRRLFFRRILGPQKDCLDTPRKEEISKYILKKFGGMPLAIISIASLLVGKEESTWEYIWKSLGSVTEVNGLEKMKQILDLSYRHLPDHLKTCLLHVCMYPEDQEIDKNDLTRQWVAEGFVVSTNGPLDAEDVAEMYFKELINMSMIQPGTIDDYSNEVMSCTVHDIILDLMRSKSSIDNFIHVIDGSKYKTSAHREIRRILVHGNKNAIVRDNEEDNSIFEKIKGSLLHARSAILYEVALNIHPTWSLLPYLQAFKYVRVLHIEYTCYLVDLDLTGITRLFMLRYLKIENSYGKLKLPGQIKELQQLETIDFGGSSYLETNPSDIGSLPWLSHLKYDTFSDDNGIALPEGVERLKFLHTLEGVHLYESSLENIKGIGKLTSLRKLHIFLEKFTESEEETTTMRMNALQSSISMISASLRILTFGAEELEDDRAVLDVPRGWSSKELFREGSAIVELDLGCCRFKSCPEWISQLRNLQKFSVIVREVADGLSVVSGLPSLAYFKLQRKNEEEEKEESVVIPGSGAFKALKNLIYWCPKAALTIEAGAMPKLEQLDLTLEKLPVGIQHLPAPTLNKICLFPDNADLEEYMKKAFKQHHPGADIKVSSRGPLV